MPLDEITGIVTIAAVLVSLAFMIKLRQSKLVYIADYQRGVRYRSDSSCEVMAPGAYRSRHSSAAITLMDMRPRQFVLEGVQFQDMLRANGVMSIAGELQIHHPGIALGAFKSLMDDALAVVRDGLRSAVLNSIIDTSAEGRVKMADAITAELSRELRASGVEVKNLEITELWVQAVVHEVSKQAN